MPCTERSKTVYLVKSLPDAVTSPWKNFDVCENLR